jgi:hypothetical protein
MKKKIIISIIFSQIYILNIAIAQNERISSSLSYESANFTNDQFKPYLLSQSPNTGFAKLAVHYKLSELLSSGVYLGYGRLGLPEPYTISLIQNGVEQERTWYGFDKSNAFSTGIELKFMLLPLFIKNETRISIYPKIQAGVLLHNTHNNALIDKTKFEYGAGIGAGYAFTRKFGVFGEFMLGDFYNDDKSKWNVGVNVKL